MSDPKQMGRAIAEFIQDRKEKVLRIVRQPYHQSRMIVCGPSGSYKSTAVDVANGLLPESEQISEVDEILRLKDFDKVIAIIEDPSLRPEISQHVAFNMVNKDLAAQIESELKMKVFWFKL
jgi:energy-coupling factor transporter ATP-binding protein EcfA2